MKYAELAARSATTISLNCNHIVKVLESTGRRISGESGAAKMMNINASTLRSRMEKLGIKKGQ